MNRTHHLSLQTQLGVLFLVLLLLPTTLLAWLCFEYAFDVTRAERIKAVGRVADARHEELVMVFRRATARAAGMLADLERKCGDLRHRPDCAHQGLSSFISSEGALGAAIGGGGGPGITAGASAVAADAIPTLMPGQLAQFGQRDGDSPRNYFVVVDEPQKQIRLAITYPVATIQSIFSSHPDLGASGETFLTDAQGFFITQPRYQSTQGHSHPIAATPMRRCLTPESAETLDIDYRDVAIIHGFRYVKAIGGGCIMAHVDQAEAFASLNRLKLGFLVAMLGLSALAALVARYFARQLTRPLSELTRVTAAIANGNHAVRALPTGYREVLELATAFNAMAEQLTAANAQLESRVQQRTESLSLMSSVFQRSGEGICITDADNNIVTVNWAFTELTGYGEDELRGRNPRMLAAGTTPREVYIDMWQALTRGGYWQGEVWDRHKDGRVFPVWLAITALRGEYGRVTHYFGSFNDDSQRKRIEQALRESEERWQFAIDGAGDGVWDWNLDSGRIVFSRRYLTMLGYADSVEWNCLDDWKDHVNPQEMQLAMTTLEAYLDGKIAHYATEYRMRRADGDWAWILARGKIVSRAADGRPLRLIGTHTDITQRKRAEDELRAGHETLVSILETTRDGYWRFDRQGRLFDVNPTYCQQSGYRREELLQMRISDLEAVESPAETAAHIARIMTTGADLFESVHKRKDGSLWQVEISTSYRDHESGQFFAFLRDISERKHSQELVQLLAFYDPLTKLPNRRLLNDRLAQAMAASKRNACYAALMFLDLDNFKPVNDQHGHEVGDLLLVEAADRLKRCVRQMDTVARFGGDEFVVMLVDLEADRSAALLQAQAVAEKIRAILCEPYLLKVAHAGEADTTIEHRCAASIGVTLFADHLASQEEVLKWADAAMYQAKQSGRNAIRFHR